MVPQLEREGKGITFPKNTPFYKETFKGNPNSTGPQFHSKPNSFNTFTKRDLGLTCDKKFGGWIFDCGATDTMSYDPTDFLTCAKPMKKIIKTANGEEIAV